MSTNLPPPLSPTPYARINAHQHATGVDSAACGTCGKPTPTPANTTTHAACSIGTAACGVSAR